MPPVDFWILSTGVTVDSLFLRFWWLPRIRNNGHTWQVWLPPVLIVFAADVGNSVDRRWGTSCVHFLGLIILAWLSSGGGGGRRRKRESPKEESSSLLDGMRGLPA